MKQRLWRLPLLLVSLALLTGCASRSRVAGRQEEYRATTATTDVRATITDNGITIAPSTIPRGNVRLTVVNTTARDQTFRYTGSGDRTISHTLRPGASVTMQVTNPRPGTYVISAPTTRQGAPGR